MVTSVAFNGSLQISIMGALVRRKKNVENDMFNHSKNSPGDVLALN